MKLKKIFLILTALVAFSSALTAVSDYEYLLGKYKPLIDDAFLVTIPGKNYLMMKTEVTQKQWQTVMENNPSYFKGDYLPVEKVSWIKAVEFCNALSEKQNLEKCYSNGHWAYYNKKKNKDVTEEDYNKDQKKEYSKQQVIKYYAIDCNFNANGYRLPTVEEWQYAAKGGQEFEYSGSDNLDKVGWYKDNSGDKTHPVAQKKPNGYGLYDMSGNVWEWCWDSDGSGGRYFCGGSWYNDADYCEMGNRYWYDADGTGKDVGFRIVRSTGK
ncbi:formylglycine-generating enzyme family protein [uncultured Treponema sp.]|uniref:formylglycine-generating enzyme family protein n=1 Tax=uncultured Treponema sp. TaxID=162155 RepID=UPI0015B88671|nr:SUMF1/EgtB/PvdO family nonheme iron enzyme [uncultured Treponema sp.]